mmetsp:Transcript_31936/g.74772  ORF Transcript_31936/g.74772 Transcript_31936/m.74772 type:complete len:817 (+) Transcript_31936:95-2545(+)
MAQVTEEESFLWEIDVDVKGEEDFVTFEKVTDVPDIAISALDGFKDRAVQIVQSAAKAIEVEHHALQEMIARSSAARTRVGRSLRLQGLSHKDRVQHSESTRCTTQTAISGVDGDVLVVWNGELQQDELSGASPAPNPVRLISQTSSLRSPTPGGYGGPVQPTPRNGSVFAVDAGSPLASQQLDGASDCMYASQERLGDGPSVGYNGSLTLGVHTAASFQSSHTRSTTHQRFGFKVLPDLVEPAEDAQDMDEVQIAAHLECCESPRHGHSSGLGSSSRLSDHRPSRGPCCFIMHPSSTWRMLWDLLAGLALSYDVWAIPLTVFNLPERGFPFFVSSVTLFYWTLDIAFSFMVGYHLPDGMVELRCSRVAYRYCTTWLVPDLLIVAVDWAVFGHQLLGIAGGESSKSAGLLRVGKLSRFIRLVTVLRLFRLRRLAKAQHWLHTYIGMESTTIVLSICRNVLFIAFMTHIFATMWFWIGLQEEDEGWLAHRKSDFWFHNYVLSLYWSIANFTPGSSGLQPVTTAELTFQVVVLFFALVVFSVFVSSTTSLITTLLGLQSAERKKWVRFKQFLTQQQFPLEFRDRVSRYVQNALGNNRSKVKMEDVELIEVLSKPLREEVLSFLHLSTLQAHHFLKMLSNINAALIGKVTTQALSEGSFSKGDAIFTFGERIEKMSFVVSGSLSYVRPSRSSHVSFAEALVEKPEQPRLAPSDHFCEAALWTKWRSRGSMNADEDCDLLDLCGSKFRKTITGHQYVATLVRQYAEAFVEDLNYIASHNDPADVVNDIYCGTHGDNVQRTLAAVAEQRTFMSSARGHAPF